LTATILVAITLAVIKSKNVSGSKYSDRSPSAIPEASPLIARTTEGNAVPPDSRPARITVTASSSRLPSGGTTYDPRNLLDGNLSTAWDEGVAGPGIGEWIRFDFDRQVRFTAMRIVPGYFKNAKLWSHNNRLAEATLVFSDGTSRHLLLDDRMAEQTVELRGVKTSSIHIIIDRIYPGSFDSEDTPISEVRFDSEP